jgi:hypothetical protein
MIEDNQIERESIIPCWRDDIAIRPLEPGRSHRRTRQSASTAWSSISARLT